MTVIWVISSLDERLDGIRQDGEFLNQEEVEGKIQDTRPGVAGSATVALVPRLAVAASWVSLGHARGARTSSEGTSPGLASASISGANVHLEGHLRAVESV